MLETLADYDDALMEQLLEDIQPPRDRVFDDLVKEMRAGAICPVLIGAAEKGQRRLRLLKAIRHEVARHRRDPRPPRVAESGEPSCR
jgi:elongation factor G